MNSDVGVSPVIHSPNLHARSSDLSQQKLSQSKLMSPPNVFARNSRSLFRQSSLSLRNSVGSERSGWNGIHEDKAEVFDEGLL